MPIPPTPVEIKAIEMIRSDTLHRLREFGIAPDMRVYLFDQLRQGVAVELVDKSGKNITISMDYGQAIRDALRKVRATT